MISGGKYVAFARIPAHRLMYQLKQGAADSSISGQGDLFGRPQTVILKVSQLAMEPQWSRVHYSNKNLIVNDVYMQTQPE